MVLVIYALLSLGLIAGVVQAQSSSSTSSSYSYSYSSSYSYGSSSYAYAYGAPPAKIINNTCQNYGNGWNPKTLPFPGFSTARSCSASRS